MKAIFLALVLLIISSTQAISTKNFNTSSTSIEKNGLAQDFVGKVNGNGSTKDYTRLNHKDVFVASENEHKHEPSVTIRKGGGWGRNEGGFRRGKGGGSGCGKAGTRMRGTGSTGVIGGASYRNAAPSLFPETPPKFILYLSLILIALFPIH